MGPTQSSAAWGCAEDKLDHEEGLLHKHGRPRQALTAHQCAKLADEHPPPQPHDPGTETDSHQVSVNPVYEFALCRKLKETFRKGDTSEPTSEVEMERLSTSVTGSDDCSASVVSVQPHSLASESGVQSGKDAETKTASVSQPSCSATQPRLVSEERSGQSQTAGQADPKSFEENGTGTEGSNHADTCSTVATSTEASPCHNTVTLNQSKTDEANLFTDQAETAQTNQPQHHTADTGAVPSPHRADTPTDRHVHTETRATQTTQPHPGDINLAPPPPRPLMISVSTPPDETSPMFHKLSPSLSYLTDDIASSPDVESDASDAGYAHLRSRFGSASQDGGAAAAAAASGASETTNVGRRKRSKKKEEKSIDYVLRALNNLGTPQEKLSALCKRYTDLHEEQKGLQALLKQHQRKMGVIQREKDQLQTEHNKAVMTKSKLESLCRELQKQNKTVKDESLLRMKEEEERRKQMSAKFQTSLADIQSQVNENHEQNLKLREENQDLSGRLRNFLEQHQVHEDQLDKLSHHRDLELRLAEARLEQASALLKEEQEQHLHEKEKILLQATEGQKKNAVLESELSKYQQRYEEFQETINRSSQMFKTLKSDMDRMGNRMKRLEREGEQWKNKWETSNTSLLEVTEEKSKCEKENQTLQSKVTKLESLCRALQHQLHQASRTTDAVHVSNDPCMETTSTSADDTTVAATPTVAMPTSPHLSTATSENQ